MGRSKCAVRHTMMMGHRCTSRNDLVSDALVHCFAGCEYTSIIAAIDGHTNGTGPNGHSLAHKDERTVVQPVEARKRPRAWVTRKTGVTTAFLNDLPVTFSHGWIRYHYAGLDATQDRQAGTKERRKNPADAHCPVIWPLDDVMPEECIFTEGQTDCVALRFLFRQEGIGVYSISGASNLPTVEEWQDMMRRGLRLAIIAFDADEAGRKGFDKAVEKALAAGLEVKTLKPPDYDSLEGTGKDWCDWVAAGGTLDTFPDANAERLLTIGDLADLMPVDYDWFVDPIIFSSGMTVIAGLPKAGKSTFVSAMAETLGRSEPFLPDIAIKGHRAHVPLTKYIVLTEEPGPPIAEHAQYGLRDDTVYYTDTLMAQRGETITDVLLRARAQASAWVVEGARVIILLDSFQVWTDVKDENAAPEVTRAVQKLRAMFAMPNVAVVVVHHLRKGGGERGEAVRGSGALAAAFDVIIEYGETTGTDDHERALNIRGRLDRGRGPQYMKVRLDGDTSRFMLLAGGDGQASINPRENAMGKVGDANREAVFAALPATVKEIEATTGFAERTVKAHLARLGTDEGRVHAVDIAGRTASRWEQGSGRKKTMQGGSDI